MELDNAYSVMVNGNTTKKLDRTVFLEPETHKKSVQIIQSVDGEERFRLIRLQQEDRILLIHVPKKIIAGFGPTTDQPLNFTLLDQNFDRKKSPYDVAAKDSDRSPRILDLDLGLGLDSPVSSQMSSSLSECSPLTADACGDSSIAPEESCSSGLGSDLDLSSTAPPSSVQSPGHSTSLETSKILSDHPGTEATEAMGPSEAKPDEGKTAKTTLRPHHGSFCEEDTEFHHLRKTNIRRWSSQPFPSGSKSRCKKKEVRFADALGLDLESVRQVASTTDPPVVPLEALRHLKTSDQPPSVDSINQVLQLRPNFSPPGSSPTFQKRVFDQKVVLDSLTLNDVTLDVTGTVCVVNFAYVKRIFVRYTIDGWLTFSDLEASYLGPSNEGRFDKFLFKIELPKSFSFGNRLEFAVCFESMNQIYWDNNFKVNYRVEGRFKQVS